MKKLLILLILVFVSGCGGTQYVMTDGGSIRIDTAGNTGAVTRGASYTQFSTCDQDNLNCQQVGDPLIQSNPTLVEQFSGVGEAALLADGIRNSGDSINNGSNSGSNASANANADAKAKVNVKKKTVIHKNPHKRH